MSIDVSNGGITPDGVERYSFKWKQEPDFKKVVDEQWENMKRADTGWRGYDFEDVPYGGTFIYQRKNYVEKNIKFRTEVESFLGGVNELVLKKDKEPEKWINLLKEVSERQRKYYPRDDYTTDVTQSYFVNEEFLPVLFSIENVFEDSNSEEKEKIIIGLCDFAQEEFNPNTDRHKLTNEVLITIINIGGIQGAERATKLIELFDEERTESIKEYNEQLGYDDEDMLPENRAYTYYEPDLAYDDNPFRSVHYVWCDAVMHKEGWADEEKRQLAVDAVKNFKSNSSGALGKYEDLLTFLGVENAVPALLENLKSEDTLTRRMSAEILCRMEMGIIGIKDSEVEYFDKVYRLMKADDPEFLVKLYSDKEAYVERIDSSGRIGVFAGDGKLLGSFNLQLASEDEQVDAEVSNITSKDFFLPKADETSQERQSRELMTTLFLSHYGKLKDDLFTQTGVRLNSVALHEQGWFALSYQQASETERGRIKSFLQEYPDLGLKVFLAADYGGTAEDILRYAESENSSKEEKIRVMRSFFQITNRASEWRNTFDIIETGIGTSFAVEAHEALIRKSSEYFKAAMVIDNGEGGAVKMEELITSMESVNYALGVLEGLRFESQFVLEDVNIESGRNSEGEVVEAMVVRIFTDSKTGSRVVVSVRPEECVTSDGKTAEARINFKIVPPKAVPPAQTLQEVRLAFDMSTYGMTHGETDKQRVSLDMGTGQSYFKTGVYQTFNVGRVLKLAEKTETVVKSEGGHDEGSFSEATMLKFQEIAGQFENYLLKFKMKEKGHRRLARNPKFAKFFEGQG